LLAGDPKVVNAWLGAAGSGDDIAFVAAAVGGAPFPVVRPHGLT
jgi:hypothetical protein